MAPKLVTTPNKRLIALRESLGMNQAKFAERIRVSLRTLQNYESTPHDKLPGPTQLVIEALENRGRLPAE